MPENQKIFDKFLEKTIKDSSKTWDLFYVVSPLVNEKPMGAAGRLRKEEIKAAQESSLLFS